MCKYKNLDISLIYMGKHKKLDITLIYISKQEVTCHYHLQIS